MIEVLLRAVPYLVRKTMLLDGIELESHTVGNIEVTLTKMVNIRTLIMKQQNINEKGEAVGLDGALAVMERNLEITATLQQELLTPGPTTNPAILPVRNMKML